MIGSPGATITLTGLQAEVNATLAQMLFTPVQFFSGVTTITFTVSDLGNAGLGGVQTNTSAIQVSVAAVHQAPVLNSSVGQPTFPSVIQNVIATQNTGGYVGDMLQSISPNGDIWFDGQPPASQPNAVHFLDLDADTGAKQGIAITNVDQTNGRWSYSLNGGQTWIAMQPTGSQALSSSFALLLPGADPLNLGAKVRFQPNANYVGPATLTFRAWDQHDGLAAGAHVNLAISGTTGGLTAYSAGTATATLNVTPTNSPPSFSLHTFSTFEDDAVATGGSSGISVPNFAFGISSAPSAAPSPSTLQSIRTIPRFSCSSRKSIPAAADVPARSRHVWRGDADGHRQQ